MPQRSSVPLLRLMLPSRLLVPGLTAGLIFVAGAAAAGTVSEICTTDPASTFDLQTDSGYIDTPDGNSVFMWSFANDPGSFQVPGPILCVHEGDTVTVNLTNNLDEPVSIVFPGQSDVSATGGVAGLLTREAPAGGGSVSYSFIAEEPGTYLYESGTNPHKQVEMGLYGAIVVRPAMGDDFAYNDAATQFDPAQEYVLVIHDIDPRLHQDVEEGKNFDATSRHDSYWTINGRSFPDTINGDGVPWMPNQPYGALIEVVALPCDPAGGGHECTPPSGSLPALIRYANAGLYNHPFHPHGNHLRVIARDGRLLGGPGVAASMEAFTKTLGSGQTYDLLARWLNEQEFSSDTNALPVVVPSNQNLVFKDDVTFYSGSPYLGEQGDFPAAVVSSNECGELYYPWHSHALDEFQNFDEGFGGLATLWRVNPPLPNSCP